MEIKPPVIFEGGPLTFNPTLVRAFKERLGISDEQAIRPEHSEVLVAYGSALSAALYVWNGGMESGNAVARVLSGKVNPSGRLPDTIAKRYNDYPSAKNFGGKKTTKACF